jgi:hypothetical protein
VNTQKKARPFLAGPVIVAVFQRLVLVRAHGDGDDVYVPVAHEHPTEKKGSKAAAPPVDDKKQEAWDLVVETYEALVEERDEGENIWGSMIKQTLKRREPGFSESYYGFRSFGQLLEEAGKQGILKLEKDEKSGGFIIKSAQSS